MFSSFQPRRPACRRGSIVLSWWKTPPVRKFSCRPSRHPPARVQDGTDGDDYLWGVAVHDDNTIAAVGYTDGDFGAVNAGRRDVVAIKLSEAGEELWRFQARASSRELCQLLPPVDESHAAGVVACTSGLDWEVFRCPLSRGRRGRLVCLSCYPESAL